MALLLRTLSRQGDICCLSRPRYCVIRTYPARMGTTAQDEMNPARKQTTAQEEMNKFWAKNKSLNRPMSPHLTIYKWSIPMMMSITHRVTGVGMSGAISAFAMAALVLPGSYPYYLDLVHSLSAGPYLISLTKFGIAFPLSFHTYNGIRHLWWDRTGKGLKIPQLYRTGYAIIALTIITSFAAAFL